MQPGTSRPTRRYPYPHPQLTSLIRVTPSGRGWFMTKEGYAVKKPFHTLPIYMTAAQRERRRLLLTFWERVFMFLRHLFRSDSKPGT